MVEPRDKFKYLLAGGIAIGLAIGMIFYMFYNPSNNDELVVEDFGQADIPAPENLKVVEFNEISVNLPMLILLNPNTELVSRDESINGDRVITVLRSQEEGSQLVPIFEIRETSNFNPDNYNYGTMVTEGRTYHLFEKGSDDNSYKVYVYPKNSYTYIFSSLDSNEGNTLIDNLASKEFYINHPDKSLR